MSDAKPEVPKDRFRPIVKRTAWTVAGMVLLLANYIGLWCLECWDPVALDERLRNVLDIIPLEVYYPLDVYAADTDYIGSDTLYTLPWWCHHGGRSSWEEAEALAMCVKHRDCERLKELSHERYLRSKKSQPLTPDK